MDPDLARPRVRLSALLNPDQRASATASRRTGRPGDVVIGLERFGASTPDPQVCAALGFTPVRVVEAAAQAARPRVGSG